MLANASPAEVAAQESDASAFVQHATIASKVVASVSTATAAMKDGTISTRPVVTIVNTATLAALAFIVKAAKITTATQRIGVRVATAASIVATVKAPPRR